MDRQRQFRGCGCNGVAGSGPYQRTKIDSLAHMGRLGFVEGTLELIEYPYLIIYRVDDARREVVVLSIMHGAQDREGRTI
jgi:plasmid stabilization system protein ParE